MTSALQYNTYRPNQVPYQRTSPKIEICVDRQLGSGRFKVFHAYQAFDGAEYALKVFPNDKSSKASYLREKEIISSLKHKNIIKHIEDINFTGLENLDTKLILMEYAPYGTLFEFVLNKALVEEKLIRTYFHQLIEGVEYLHSQGVSHNDLKLDNVLLGEDFTLKIIDFDQSQRAEESTISCRGTACYRAPEILEGKCENLFAADVYSLGVMLFTTKAREFPFVEMADSEGTSLIHYDLFTEENEEFWKTKVEGKINSDFFSQEFKSLVNGMLESDPRKRLTIEKIKQSRWYNGPTYHEGESKMKMERVWERVMFKKSLKRGHSPTQ